MLQFGPNMHNKGLSHSVYEWATKGKNSINKSRSTKADRKPSKTFYFTKI